MNKKLKSTIAAFLIACGTLHGQCVVGNNTPPPFISSGEPVSLPEHLTVGYIMPDVSTDLWTAIADAIQTWGDYKHENNSDISFVEYSSIPSNTDTVYPNNCYYPNCPTELLPFIYIERDPASMMNGDVGLSTCAWAPFGSVEHPAYRCVELGVALSDAITDPTYMWATMAHELGHGMALSDCTTCVYPSTVMTSGQSPLNNHTDPLGPSPCDNQQVYQTAFPN